MLIPFSSLLTFPSLDRNQQQTSTPVNNPKDDKKRSILPPPTSHIVCTTNFPAPASFLPWHYAKHTLKNNGVVIWIGCTGTGEEHVRQTLRKAGATSNASRNAHLTSKLVYFDAFEAMQGGTMFEHASSSTSGNDSSRLALLRLQHRLEQILERIPQSDSEGEIIQSQQILVIIEDAAALAWTIERLTSESIDVFGDEGKDDSTKQVDDDKANQDPRIQLLREKRRMGNGTAIHKDEIGHLFGQFIIDQIWKQTCVPANAILLTHLTTDNTSIEPPKSHLPATRGGSYGVGTGFDADDAGEENEDEELYEDQPEDWQQGDGKEGEQESGNQTKSGIRRSAGVAAANIDWRVDSLLRQLIPHSDIWIEMRGLRSGKARDCHGEVCVYGLGRPSKARNVPLPKLPMPADPLTELRSQDRTLSQFNQLSLTSTTRSLFDNNNKPTHDKNASALEKSTIKFTLHAWKMEVWCEGREKAMLFRIDPNGEAMAWSRGAAHGATDSHNDEI
jgi:hypothetical protein